MTDDEEKALQWAGADPLVLNAALHPRIPMSLTEAYNAPLCLLMQADALMRAWRRMDKRRALIAAHEAHKRGRRRG